MRTRLALSFGLVLACVARPATTPETTPVVAESPTPAPTPPKCAVKSEPAIVVSTLVIDPAARCRGVSAALERSTRKAVTAAWHRSHRKGTLEVTMGCDRLGDTITTMDLEVSSGHGGSLHLVRFERDASGDHSLLWIRYNHYQRDRSRGEGDPWQEDAIGKLELLRGRVPAATMTALLDRVRADAFVEVVEREPPPTPGKISLHGFMSSSRDFGVHLRLVDDAGHGVERFFAGYEGSGPEQQQSVPADLAGKAVLELVYDDAFAKTLEIAAAQDADVRALFGEWFARARARDAEFGSWYIRERYVGLAAGLGGHREIPALLGLVDTQGDASSARTRVLAINAIAALTGFDPRYDAGGQPRAPEVVAAEVTRECR